MKWSQWKYFKDLDWENIRAEAGVYKIRCVDKGKPVRIERLNETDKEGILGIGESKNLRRRLKQFWASVCKQEPDGMKRKSRAWLYLEFKYYKLYPKDFLQFRYIRCNNKDAAKNEERKLLRGYRLKYKDGPPLNRTI